jgi:TonB family protein
MTSLNKIVRRLITACFLLFVSKVSFAQKDTLVYYLTNSGRQVNSKDSAQLFLVILPPDTTVDKTIFPVRGYYPNGRPRIAGGSLTRSLPLKLQGYYIEFFPNGRRMRARNFSNGGQIGDDVGYYPNGKLYYKRSLSDELSERPDFLLEECRDSTGNILTQNGDGAWIVFNSDFSKIVEKGGVHNGHRDSTWVRLTSDGQYVPFPAQGIDRSGSKIFTSVQQVPEFPGGIEAMYRFLSKNLVYPSWAKSNNFQGRVIISFVVEKDGTLTDMKIYKGIGGGFDEEALRVMRLSPLWKPGIQNGHPVRVAYSVPINFTLSDQ